MSDNKEMPVPTLTLDPALEEAENAIEIPEEKETKDAVFDETTLTPEEKKMVDDFAETITISDTGTVIQYGAGSQKKMADFSQNALENVRTKDLGEVGDMLSGLVTELKGFGEPEKKGFFSKLNKKLGIQEMKARYAKAETNVNKIVKTLEGHQVALLKDIATLDKLYDLNRTYFKELSMYIIAGKKKLQEVQEKDLSEMRAKAQASGLPEDAQAANDLAASCNRFEKKIYDLELTRTISIQMAPQIRLVQGNDSTMSEKIQSTLVNTIPLWKSQMVLALGIAHSEQAAKAQREVSDMTNELLNKNADKLKMATIETAKESERGIVDLETLKHTNESLITTIDEVIKIQDEGRQKRKDAEIEIARIEGELKEKLLSMK